MSDDTQKEWFKTQMAKERISPRTKQPPSTATGSLVVSKRSGMDGYTMRIHTISSSATVEANFSDEASAYNEGVARLADIMEREATLRGHSEFAIYRQGRLVDTKMLDIDISAVDVTPTEEGVENVGNTEESVVDENSVEDNVEGDALDVEEAPEAEPVAPSGEQLSIGIDFIEDPMASQPNRNAAPAQEPVEAIAGHEIAGQLSFMDETEDSTVKLVDQRFEDDSIIVTFEASEDATLWRKIGDSERTKKLKAGTNEVTYKIDEGEEFEFRLESEDGTVLGNGTR